MSESSSPATVVLTVVRDLLFRPRVDSTLQHAGFTPVAYTVNQPVADQVPGGIGGDNDTDCNAVGLVDLGDGDAAIQAVVAMRAAGLPVVGYCGHVDQGAQEAGMAAGVTLVASRGQVHGDLPSLIKKALATRPDPDCDHC